MKIYKVAIITDYNYSDEIEREEEYFIDLDNAMWEAARFGPSIYSESVCADLGYLAYHTTDEWQDDHQAFLFTEDSSPKFRQTAILTVIATYDFSVESAQAKRRENERQAYEDTHS